MSLNQNRIIQYLPPFSSLLGVLALGGGIYGLSNPTDWSGAMGVSALSPQATLPYVSFTAARNVGSGLTILALYATGNKEALGIALMCGTSVAFLDAWICNAYGAEHGKATGHAIMGVVVGAFGAALYYTT